jgi:Non-classical export protein 1
MTLRIPLHFLTIFQASYDGRPDLHPVTFGGDSYLGPLRLTTSGKHRPNYSLASTLDPLLGIFTGVSAYYPYETDPQTAPAPEQKLDALVRWKFEKYQANRYSSLILRNWDDSFLSLIWGHLPTL